MRTLEELMYHVRQVLRDEASVTSLKNVLHELIADAEREERSRAMFVTRLENMDKSGYKWIGITAVLALLNDCDMLAARETSTSNQSKISND